MTSRRELQEMAARASMEGPSVVIKSSLLVALIGVAQAAQRHVDSRPGGEKTDLGRALAKLHNGDAS